MAEAPCPFCGQPMKFEAGTAILCGPAGAQSLRLPATLTCRDPQCIRTRDDVAIERAIASGLIDP